MDGNRARHGWSEFEAAAPELAALGRERLGTDVPNYLATVRGGALPRVHPVSARVSGGRLALYMYPSSPKGKDLVADGRYALHCAVADQDGGAGEFSVRGFATRADDVAHQAALAAAGFPMRDGYVVFELGVEEAFSCIYDTASGSPVIQRWQHPQHPGPTVP